MGWDFQHRDKGQKTEDIFRQEFSNTEILASRVVDGVWYAAARHPEPDHYYNDVEGGRVFALVCPTQWASGNYCNWGYKAQDETVGPVDVKCPKKVFDLLTPLPEGEGYEYAREWRQRVGSYHAKVEAAKAVKEGDVVTFANKIEFSNGDTVQTLTFQGGSLFSYGYQRYRLTDWKERDFTVVLAAGQPAEAKGGEAVNA